jgi:hypothetical protein
MGRSLISPRKRSQSMKRATHDTQIQIPDTGNMDVEGKVNLP